MNKFYTVVLADADHMSLREARSRAELHARMTGSHCFVAEAIERFAPAQMPVVFERLHDPAEFNHMFQDPPEEPPKDPK